ncbi:hypothetical protein [Spirosoma montaniterrae]|uniref:hypothetical protein n=1 Tax=Spirosoma montaniterrae TaxID=1178516 RepID=UPI00269EBCB8
MKNMLVVGLGKVGSLVGTLLHKRFSVTGFDRQTPAEVLPFPTLQGDVADEALLRQTVAGFDGVVSCLPYNLNLPIAKPPSTRASTISI